MTDEEFLAPYLVAWREDSRRAALPHSRELARAAMLEAVAGGRRAVKARALWFSAGFHLRGVRLRLAGAVVALAAAGAMAALGWNAPAGSFLHGVRAARQSLQLAVPGADQAALHLDFAEEYLTDARDDIDPVASLADARAELLAAQAVLPADHSSPLWSRWISDEATAATDEATPGQVPVGSPEGSGGESLPPAVAHGSPTADDSEAPESPAPHGLSSSTGTLRGSGSSSPSPSGDDGAGGAGSGGGPSPTGSPHDE